MTWTEERRIEVPRPEPLPEKHSNVKEMQSRSGPHDTSALDEFLRKECSGRKAMVQIHYLGEKCSFIRDFELDAAADGSVIWNPGAVRLS